MKLVYVEALHKCTWKPDDWEEDECRTGVAGHA